MRCRTYACRDARGMRGDIVGAAPSPGVEHPKGPRVLQVWRCAGHPDWSRLAPGPGVMHLHVAMDIEVFMNMFGRAFTCRRRVLFPQKMGGVSGADFPGRPPKRANATRKQYSYIYILRTYSPFRRGVFFLPARTYSSPSTWWR